MTARDPSAEQWRAVGDAYEKITARGRWACYSPYVAVLPPHDLRWVDPEDPPAELNITRANAATAFYADGSIAVFLRLDADPTDLHRSCLHELIHVADAQATGARTGEGARP